jgi:hypothetical protein
VLALAAKGAVERFFARSAFFISHLECRVWVCAWGQLAAFADNLINQTILFGLVRA